MLPIEVKSQGSLDVNTPEKKDSVQEPKVFETIDGIQTFGRPKVCSDRKVKSNDNSESTTEINQNIFETRIRDLEKPAESAAADDKIKSDRKAESVKKNSPQKKV